MRAAVWTFVVALVIAIAALAYNFIQDAGTREKIRVVERTVDPCKRPKSEACQRRIRLVLKELVRRHPKVLKELGLKAPETVSQPRPKLYPGGGGADNPPSGGGPTGRVPAPRPGQPAPPPPNPPPEPDPKPLLDLEPPAVCVGDLVRINCD